MLESVPNVSEGRDRVVLERLARACGDALLDRHVDVDHHRSVFTLAGPDTADAVQQLAVAVLADVDLRVHRGVHPRLGALDVVPFVSLAGSSPADAVAAAHRFAAWAAETLELPVFLYDDADGAHRTLPDARRDAFRVARTGSRSAAPASDPRCGGGRRAPAARRGELRTGGQRRRASRARSRAGYASGTAGCPACGRSGCSSTRSGTRRCR